VGKTYSKWLTGSNEGTALSAEEQSAEQQLRASGDFDHASSHSKRVFRAKKDDRRAKAFTADELEADYRVALDQVGGQAGVERLIRQELERQGSAAIPASQQALQQGENRLRHRRCRRKRRDLLG
jgi:hypothetical protein